MNDKYRQQWETLGEEDPYWAVLSEQTKKVTDGRKRSFSRREPMKSETFL